MALANNGVLICAMLLAFGLARGDRVSIAAAFAMAGTSYIVNTLDGMESPPVSRDAAVAATLLIGGLAYIWLAFKIFGGA